MAPHLTAAASGRASVQVVRVDQRPVCRPPGARPPRAGSSDPVPSLQHASGARRDGPTARGGRFL